ncbi:hypothetical protein PAMP_014609 [Pampus punctatissimus]
MERTYLRTSPPPTPPEKHREDGLVGRTLPVFSSPLSPDEADPTGQTPDTDAPQTLNEAMQQVPDHPCEVVQQLTEQIQHVLQEQSRLLTLVGTDEVASVVMPREKVAQHRHKTTRPTDIRNHKHKLN